LKQGEKISNLENASQNLIHLPLTICKRTLKRIYKRICKNKTCGASVVQNVKNQRNNPCISYKVLIGLIPSNLCTYILQTSSIMHFYTCFGLCWHCRRFETGGSLSRRVSVLRAPAQMGRARGRARRGERRGGRSRA
jgi:hypothetical protein